MGKKARTIGILGLVGGVVTSAIVLTTHATPKKAGATPVVHVVTNPNPVTVPTTIPIPDPKPAVVEIDGKVQIAILLDTSSSMDGLIEQAKSQLWKMVNEVSSARRQGKRPRVEIALYEYGKSTLSPESGFIRRILPLTDDLDRVSEELFALRTNGGDEFCGQVIDTAVGDLDWSSSFGDVKLIFIAGNEGFGQGPVDWHKSISKAKEKGITVNTIHCGDVQAGENGGWRDAAVLAQGVYLAIDHDRKVVHIAAPQDAEIARLGVELNGTYLGYGVFGVEAGARQMAQDMNAKEAKQGAEVQRAVAKASGAYQNATWDLVDATRDGTIDLETCAEDVLPEEMKKMSVAERKAFVAKKQTERAALQKRIAELDAERRAFVAEEMKKQGLESDNTLDAAMIKAVRDQAGKAGWKWE